MERKEEFLEEKKENLKMQETQRGALVNFGANFNFFFAKKISIFRSKKNFPLKVAQNREKINLQRFFGGGVPSARP